MTTFDVSQVRPLTRRIITSWIVLAAEIPRRELPAALDEALLSASTLRTRIKEPLQRFWDSAAAPHGDLPMATDNGEHVPG